MELRWNRVAAWLPPDLAWCNRVWAKNSGPKRSNTASAGTGSGVLKDRRGWLLPYAVAALPGGVR